MCKSSKKYQLPRFGDPVLCVGANFTVSQKYGHKFEYGDELEVGKIHSVVRRHGSNNPFFKFYNFHDYPHHLPPVGSSSFMYVECKKMMSIDVKKTGIKWTVRNTSSTKLKPTKQHFEVVYGVPTRGLYDKEDVLDTLQKKRRLQRQKDSVSDDDESGSSDDNDDDDDDVPICKLKNRSKQVIEDSCSSSSESSDSEFVDDINDKKYFIDQVR